MEQAEGMEHGVSMVQEVVIFLIAAVVVIPLFQRLKASPVLGYLFIGTVIGPHGLAIIPDAEAVQRLAELGVVFLLFTIGLELSFERLKAMRRLVFGLGTAQVLVSGFVIGAVAYAWGNETRPSIIIGFGLALSSTALVMQLLIESNEIASRTGRTSFAILLLQDLAVVPLLVLVTLFAVSTANDGGSVWETLGLAMGQALLAVGLILVLGRLVLRNIFRLIAGTHNRELFMALSLLVILSTALLTGTAGLSMALGAFLAGLLLAETEFRHQVETDIEPFKGLLLGLFFISVGMQIDFAFVEDRAFWLAASVFGLIGVKALLIMALCLMFTLPLVVAVRTGLLLGEGGEFAFVIFGTAITAGVLSPEIGQFMIITAGLSMILTPFLAALGRWLLRVIERETGRTGIEPTEITPEDLRDHVIIAGYGRVGQTVAKLLSRQKVPFVALDLNVPRVRDCRTRGDPIFYGDASRYDMLCNVGADRAAIAVITLDNYEAASRTLASMREHWPDMPIFVRARDASHAADLYRLGATGVVPETFESSLALSGQVLYALGQPRESVNQLVEQIRGENYASIEPEPRPIEAPREAAE